jgi:ABC-type phosphate transport system auxiliary subunit
MALKFKYNSKDEIPTELMALYAEREGAWQLDVDGVADKAKLDEFRSNNTALLKQIEEHKKRFEGIDPDEVRKLAEQKARLEEERQLKAGELDKVVENRIKGLKADWDKQVATLTSEREAVRSKRSNRPAHNGLWGSRTVERRREGWFNSPR